MKETNEQRIEPQTQTQETNAQVIGEYYELNKEENLDEFLNVSMEEEGEEEQDTKQFIPSTPTSSPLISLSVKRGLLPHFSDLKVNQLLSFEQDDQMENGDLSTSLNLSFDNEHMMEATETIFSSTPIEKNDQLQEEYSNEKKKDEKPRKKMEKKIIFRGSYQFQVVEKDGQIIHQENVFFDHFEPLFTLQDAAQLFLVNFISLL